MGKSFPIYLITTIITHKIYKVNKIAHINLQTYAGLSELCQLDYLLAYGVVINLNP